jgi:hypothetical protein
MAFEASLLFGFVRGFKPVAEILSELQAACLLHVITNGRILATN